uniref:Uncharacterized protein n=1 Tax=Arundo donax TaxID=35708 RepID=A0A0A8ZPX9_ARUDO
MEVDPWAHPRHPEAMVPVAYITGDHAKACSWLKGAVRLRIELAYIYRVFG